METNKLKPYQAQEVGLTASQMERFGISEPQQIVELSKEVAKYVESNALSTVIQGGKYVLVEGWQFAAGLLGLTGRIEKFDNLSSYEEVTFTWKAKNWSTKQWENKTHKTKVYKYTSAAVFVDRNDRVVSQAFALCSNEETKKHTFDEYSILSMAQTRALGKAARMSFSFLIKAAGYEPTPAEEMDGVEEKEAQVTSDPLPEDIDNQIYVFTEGQDLADWANDQKEYLKNMIFVQKVKEQLKVLNHQKPKK